MAEKTFITRWNDRPLTELSREELIAVIEYLALELEAAWGIRVVMRGEESGDGRTKEQIEADAAAFKKGVWDQINAAKRAGQ